MNKNWSNTALVAYSSLPKICQELDFCVKSRVNSAFQSKHLRNGIQNEQLIGEILQLNDEKRKIVNLRFIVSEALKKIENADKRILTLRMLEKKTFQQISEIMEISLRSVFRRLANAENSFELNLKKAGYGEEWLENEYGNDKYIRPIYKRIINDKYFVAKNL